VLVPESGAPTAREVLLQAELVSPEPPTAPVAPARLLVGLLLALVVGAALVWAIAALLH
jgi:hypothetical protein